MSTVSLTLATSPFDASTATVALSAITVDASGTALGAVAQNGSVLSGWDAEIVRLGAAAANDALFTGSLDIAGAVGPPCFPPIDDVRASGIGALVGP